MKRVVVAIILGPERLMLMGQRRDSGKWTNPAGGCNEGEDAHAALCREVKEETGLHVEDAQLVRAGMTESGMLIYLFLVRASGQIDTTNDPDEECEYWTWEDPMDRLGELHVPAEKNYAVQWYAQHYDVLRKF